MKVNKPTSYTKKTNCINKQLVKKYSPNDYIEVRATIDTWIGIHKDKSILRMRSEHAIENWQWIYWN